jgi:hypothetical protein
MWLRLAERVVAAFQELAHDTEQRSIVAQALGGLLVVGVVRARLASRALRGLVQRPAPGSATRSTGAIPTRIQGGTTGMSRGRRKMRKERESEVVPAVPRYRVSCPAVVVSGGVGYPVTVELEDVVGCCH